MAISTFPDSSNRPHVLNGTNGINGHCHRRTRIVVVGLGMVALSFIEKILKLDAKEKRFDLVVLGEERHVAYNRVFLSTYFENRNEDWYAAREPTLKYHLDTRVTEILPKEKLGKISTGLAVEYDILVLATGSSAVLPRTTPGHDANGVFVHRSLHDLQQLIEFSEKHKHSVGVTIGSGLLGLEAAKSMLDMNTFRSVKLVDRNRWVLARQLDGDAGTLVTEKIRELGLDVLLQKRVARIDVDGENRVKGIVFEDGEWIECSCICFAIGVKPRDEIARAAGLHCSPVGGLVVNSELETSESGLYAIGEVLVGKTKHSE